MDIKNFTSGSGNKIVDKSGYPIKVYHATNQDFNEFDLNKKGSNTGSVNTVHGIFFTDKKENTTQFGERVIEAYIFMKKPLDMRFSGVFNNINQASDIVEIIFGKQLAPNKALKFLDENVGLGEIYEFVEELNTDNAHKLLVKKGYDGIISDMGNHENEYIVFDTKQILQINENESINTKRKMRKIKINEHQAQLLGLRNKNKKYKITLKQYNKLIKPLNESKQKINEDIFSPELHHAVLKLINDIYNNPSQAGLDSFWRRNGITWGDLAQFLTGAGLLIALPTGAYKLATKIKDKFFNKPEEAVQAVEKSVAKLLKPPTSLNKLKDPNGQVLMKQPKKEIDEYSSNFPGDLEDDPLAPWNARDYPKIPGKVSKESKYKVLAYNDEIALITDESNQLYVFDLIGLTGLDDYAERYELGDGVYSDSEIDASVIQNYINDNIGSLSLGDGIDSFNHGDSIVRVDEALKNELMNLYDKSKGIVKVLSDYFKDIKEDTVAGSSASGGSSGPFVAPMTGGVIKKTMYPEDELNSMLSEGPVAGPASSGGSSGPYDANALPGIGREGNFKKTKKTSAQIKTQYPKGDFVEMDSCTKLNNNKSAQNGQCSSGAIDNVVKLRKGVGSVISKE